MPLGCDFQGTHHCHHSSLTEVTGSFSSDFNESMARPKLSALKIPTPHQEGMIEVFEKLLVQFPFPALQSSMCRATET